MNKTNRTAPVERLCIECGKMEPVAGSRLCAYCQRQRTLYAREYRAPLAHATEEGGRWEVPMARAAPRISPESRVKAVVKRKQRAMLARIQREAREVAERRAKS